MIGYNDDKHDEKMFRVVMDRERWFNVVIAEKHKVDLKTTDQYALRLIFLTAASERLMFNLEV